MKNWFEKYNSKRENNNIRMSNSNGETPININITKDSKSSDEIYNEFKDYIIKNNIVLQDENVKNRELVKSLECKIETYEDNEDKNDVRIRYMKGLLQNLNELKIEYNNITKRTEVQLKNANNFNKVSLKLYKEICYISILMQIAVEIIINTFTIYYIFPLILNTILIGMLSYGGIHIKNNYHKLIIEKKKLNSENSSIGIEITSIKNEIKKTEEACLSLDNWICEI